MNRASKQSRLSLWRLVLAGMVMVFAGCAQTGRQSADHDSHTAAESIAARYVQESIRSVETADQALNEVGTEREAIRRDLAVEERACYERFFTNLCLNRVEERERSAMEQLRRVEIEANAFKRRERAERRDTQGQQEKRGFPMPAAPGATAGRPGDKSIEKR